LIGLAATLAKVIGSSPDRIALYSYAHVPYLSSRNGESSTARFPRSCAVRASACAHPREHGREASSAKSVGATWQAAASRVWTPGSGDGVGDV